MKDNLLFTSLVSELKRGNLTLCVLSQLKTPQYGYSLLQTLSEQHIEIEANTLYPMLRRLESQGLLDSSWDTTESRPRKFYSLSTQGQTLFIDLLKAWKEQNKQTALLLGEESHA